MATTTVSDIIELSACVDCVVWLANGDLPPEDDSTWSPYDIQWDGYHLCVGGDEDTEEWFSWSPCECCGSRLGGSRYPVLAWKV